MEEEGGGKLHIAVLPWLAYGHLSPFLEFSNRISLLGHHVSFLSTPSNLQALTLSHSATTSPNLHLIPLSSFTLSLQSPLDDPDGYSYSLINKAYDSLAGDLAGFLQTASPPVNWLLYDYNPYWSPSIAKSFNIHTAFLCPFSAATLAFLGRPESLTGEDTSRSSPHHLVVKPDWIPFPSKLSYKPHEARIVYNSKYLANNTSVSQNFRLGSSLAAADVIAVRSCFEFEPEWLPLLEKLYCKPVIPAGHFPSSVQTKNYKCWDEAFEWLDKQERRSVVYVAFGSMLHLKKEEVGELARGLEISKLAFVWAYRGKEELLPVGFEERVQGRGVVCKGWVPQTKFLAHEAIGGFLTHCGWNSLVEAMGLGVALVLLPMVADEGLNARLMEEKKVGVEVPRREEDGGFDGEGVARVLRLVMVEKEGEEIRVRAEELGRVLGRREVHDGYVKVFVEYLKKFGM